MSNPPLYDIDIKIKWLGSELSLRNISNGDNDFGDISVVADVEHLEHVIQRFNCNQLLET